MQKEFNLIKYVYGRLYAGTFQGSVVIELRSKVYSWLNVLNWLKKEGYIFSYKVTQIEDKSRIEYVFNRNNLIYKPYLKGIDRNMKIYSLDKVPTGEIVEQLKISEFEEERLMQVKKPVEYISKEDHTRCFRTNDEIYAA